MTYRKVVVDSDVGIDEFINYWQDIVCKEWTLKQELDGWIPLGNDY